MEKLHHLSGREKIVIVGARLMDADGYGEEEKEALADSAPSSLSTSSLQPALSVPQLFLNVGKLHTNTIRAASRR
jgi:hypothetical protein